MSQKTARHAGRADGRVGIACQEIHGEEPKPAAKETPPSGRVSSGSALVRNRSDVSSVLEALTTTLRGTQFGDRELFGVRVSLEVAIDAVLSSTDQGMRVRYHLGPDGLLLDVEAQQLVSPILTDQTLHLLRHFMTEARVHDRGVMLYRRLPGLG